MPPVAFSSLMMMARFLESLPEGAGVGAGGTAGGGRGARGRLLRGAPEALSATIRRYQALGCWLGDLEIPRDLYEQALEVFLRAGAVAHRHPCDQLVVPAPE